MTNPYELAERAAGELRERSGVDSYDVAIVLGSGWKEGAVALGEPSSVVDVSQLSGFFAPTVAGHRGEILSVLLTASILRSSPVESTCTRVTTRTKWCTQCER